MFKGVYTALVTPFLNGEIDFPSLDKLIDQQLSNGIQGFVVCGTTAESPTLTNQEKLELLQFTTERVKGKVPILFGSGSNCTKKTIELSQAACEFKIDGLLVVVPYYNKPPQEGLLAHFTAVADASNKPIVMYNVPGRTVTSLAADTIIELAKHPNIRGIKEADGDLNNFSKYKSAVGDDFALLSGDDESCVSFCLLGGHGVISVCSHVAPAAMVKWIHRAINKDESVREEYRRQQLWISNLYMTSNPIPVKAALNQKGVIASKEMRLPLVELNDTMTSQLMKSFENFQDIL
ncbi:MAG: 4-hydroxy-tetrahydrodipicolinate synthase [Bdellovibrionales bacterium]|nr:4-hydroxy-tetrahydrodipicolinate synthase [Bdellovibrionales bacterium]